MIDIKGEAYAQAYRAWGLNKLINLIRGKKLPHPPVDVMAYPLDLLRKPKSPFAIRPRRWYQYLSPTFWRSKRLMEAMIDHSKLGEKVEDAWRRYVLFGERFGE